MTVYISSHSREKAINLQRWLLHCAINIVSTWHDDIMNPSEELSLEERQSKSERNLRQIDSADVLVLIDSPEKVPSGKFVEAGYALGKGKRVIVHGRRENMMLWHESVQQTDNMGELADLIRA